MRTTQFGSHYPHSLVIVTYYYANEERDCHRCYRGDTPSVLPTPSPSLYYVVIQWKIAVHMSEKCSD